jgi:7-cyano-7-deazaguanine synthase
MDSAVTLAKAKALGFEVFALSIRYGQTHAAELAAAARVARALGAREHRSVALDLAALGGSALVGAGAIPKDRAPGEIGAGVPATYVPARNAVFLAVALGWAETLGARDLFLGVNAVDFSGYPDCRPAFLEAFEALAESATAAGAEGGARFRVHAPLLDLSKKEIVLLAEELGVDLGLTHTCYAPLPGADPERPFACGRCDACLLRLKGFREAGRVDPLPYAEDAAPASAGPRPLDPPPAVGEPRTDALRTLLAILDRLRAPQGGCPWDLKQTLASLAPSVVEEAHELVEAIESADDAAAVEEAGDLLMAVLLLCRIAEDECRFSAADAARAVADKLVRRHPHVFGEAAVGGAEQVLANWERIKAAERREKAVDASALAGVPRALPALQRAQRLAAKALAAGFRWTSPEGALAKVEEEARELRAAFAEADPERLTAELGDLLMASAFLATYLDRDAERATRDALRRFESRFRSMEAQLGAGAREATLERWMEAWRAAKALE